MNTWSTAARVLACTLAAAAAGALPARAAPDVAPAVLREIGSDPAHPVGAICGKLVVHANSAIGAALADDAGIGKVVRLLRDTDFEQNAIARGQGLSDLRDIANNVNGESLHGDDEIKRLLGAGPAVPSPPLKRFAAAMNQTLAMQRQLATEIAHLAALVEFRATHSMINDQHDEILTNDYKTEPRGKGAPVATPLPSMAAPNIMARTAGEDYKHRVLAIAAVEATAADASVASVTGCDR